MFHWYGRWRPLNSVSPFIRKNEMQDEAMRIDLLVCHRGLSMDTDAKLLRIEPLFYDHQNNFWQITPHLHFLICKFGLQYNLPHKTIVRIKLVILWKVFKAMPGVYINALWLLRCARTYKYIIGFNLYYNSVWNKGVETSTRLLQITQAEIAEDCASVEDF